MLALTIGVSTWNLTRSVSRYRRRTSRPKISPRGGIAPSSRSARSIEFSVCVRSLSESGCCFRSVRLRKPSAAQSRICGRTYQTETPATADTGAGADCFSESAAAQVERYITGVDPASFNDTEPPQPVVAYVSRGFIYQVDDTLTVVAYGRLTRCGVRS